MVTTNSFAGDRVRVVHPDSVDVSSTSGLERRVPPDPTDVTPLVVEALVQQGFSVVDQLDVTPQRGVAALTDPVGTVEIEVDVAEQEDVVLLVQSAGVYRWHLPAALAGVPARLGVVGTARFAIDGTTSSASVLSFDTTSLDDSGVGATPAVSAVGTARARTALETLPITLLESFVRTGLVHIAQPDPTTWSDLDGKDAVLQTGLAADTPASVLLFVHGTFDNTRGAFGALGLQPDGVAFLTRAIEQYDAVLGFDHKTLSVDPLQNARQLDELLAPFAASTALTVDVVCHSRGGLVTRSLAEKVLPSAGRGSTLATTDRIVFLGATNAGTHLADPASWGSLADQLTTLVAARTRVIRALPGGDAVADLLVTAVQAVGALVRWLVTHVTTGPAVPGLAAMDPDGPFIASINLDDPGSPPPGSPWFVVSSDFHVTGRSRPAQLPLPVARALETAADAVLEDANDLVVDLESMSAINLPLSYVRGELAFGTNSRVHHLNYPNQPRVARRLGYWLLQRRG